MGNKDNYSNPNSKSTYCFRGHYKVTDLSVQLNVFFFLFVFAMDPSM